MNMFLNKHYFIFYVRRIYKMKIELIIFKIIKKLFNFLFSLILLPLSIFLHLLGVRHFKVFAERIGHLAIEPDCLIKEIKLGRKKSFFYLIVLDRKYISNQHLMNYWKKYFYISQSKSLFYFINVLSKFGLMSENPKLYIKNENASQHVYDIYNQWKEREPLIKIKYEDTMWSREILSKIGLPKSSWYIVIHVRTEGFSSVDDDIQYYRNSNIDKLLPAIKKITDLGGWVIRIGDNKMPKLKKMNKVFDYAHSDLKSARMDFCLIAQAKFMIGNTSGVACLASVLDVPCVALNIIPLPVAWLTKKDIFIPKLIWDKKHDRYLTFKEILEKEISFYNFSNQYKKANLDVVENSEQEILCIVNEMIDVVIKNKKIKTIKYQFNSFFKKSINKKHYGYFSTANISKSFVKSNKKLFR
jgi:putative glycosyltransferase (TIGR04372 family)